jgi:hypothetical protein
MLKNTHMKRLLFCLFVILISAHLKSQTKVFLQEGTIVQVVLNENLDSKICKVGDPVSLEVFEDVVIDSMVVIAKGTHVDGTIVETKEANFAGIQGQLGFSIDYTMAVDGQRIKLRSYQQADGESRTEEVVIAAVILSPLFLVFKGKNVIIEKGTVYSVYVDKDYEFIF